METLNINLCCCFLTEKVKLNVGELFCVGTSVKPAIPHLALSSHPPICTISVPTGPAGQESWHHKSRGCGSYRPSEGQWAAGFLGQGVLSLWGRNNVRGSEGS